MSQTVSADNARPSYLEILAYLGLSRHLGGWAATNELASLCHVEKGKQVLDVGCGIGKTSAAFAKRGSSVVGVDISARMVEWARETAEREGVIDRVEFKTADARQLPFDDATFDVVLCESVLAFVLDKDRALGEFIRVCKPGGWVGLNETMWLASSVPPEIVAALEGAGFGGARFLTIEEWRSTVNASRLRDVVMKTYHTSARGDVLDRIRWFGITGILRNIGHMVSFAASNRANRAALAHYISWSRRIPETFYDYYGYAICAGRK